MKKIQKKGAIELSVTAIIVLILAIVMLGLGLGFIRGMFSKVSTSFEEQIVAEPEPRAPSMSEPLTLSREIMVTHAKEDEVLKVGVYNPSSSVWGTTAPGISCSELGSITQKVNNRSLAQGEAQTFNLLMTMPSAATQGSYLCYAFIRGNSTYNVSYTKDLTIKIIK